MYCNDTYIYQFSSRGEIHDWIWFTIMIKSTRFCPTTDKQPALLSLLHHVALDLCDGGSDSTLFCHLCGNSKHVFRGFWGFWPAIMSVFSLKTRSHVDGLPCLREALVCFFLQHLDTRRRSRVDGDTHVCVRAFKKTYWSWFSAILLHYIYIYIY